MERLRRLRAKRSAPGESWQAPLATALQHAQLIYLLGSAFVGIAYQPFVLMLIGLQCGLWSYCARTDAARVGRRRDRPALVPLTPPAAS